MAKSWHGYRALVLDGRRFRWECSFNEPLDKLSSAYSENGMNWPPDTLTVLPEIDPHRRLTVTWPACCGPIVMPRFVRLCIEQALARGWLDEHAVMTMAGAEVASG
jgi:hypothetical protein